MQCWRNGECVAWNRLTVDQAKGIKVGYVFGPNYSYYSEFNTIPQPVVTQHHLAPTNKYVSADGYVRRRSEQLCGHSSDCTHPVKNQRCTKLYQRRGRGGFRVSAQPRAERLVTASKSTTVMGSRMTTSILLFALSVAAASPPDPAAPPKISSCSKWEAGICLSVQRAKGASAPYAVGYVFGPRYAYTPISDIPPPVVTYFKLQPDKRYVYKDGYLYQVDTKSYPVIQVIDTYAH